MGRHSDPSPLHYYRSVGGWFLPWVLLAAVVGIVVWVGVDVLGKDDISTPEPPEAAVAVSPLESPEPESSPEPVAAVTPTPTEKPKERAEPKTKVKGKKTKRPPLITEDITVQVLNATNGSPDADDRMADKLADLGYEVVALGEANRVYERTTVFWSFPAAKEAAQRLAERFGWASALKPSNLSNQVDFHVVVGQDF